MGYCPDKGHLAVAEGTQGCQRPGFCFKFAVCYLWAQCPSLQNRGTHNKGFKAIQSKQVVPFGP